MKLTVEMPLTTYDCMMEGCAQSSPEFRLLVGGLIERRPKQDHFERFIQIFCEDRQAQILLNLARQVCPEVVGTIKTTRGLPRGGRWINPASLWRPVAIRLNQR